MKSVRGLAAVVIILVGTSPLSAQVLVGPGIVAPGISIGGSYRSGRLNIGFRAFAPAYGYYAPFYPYGYSNTTTIYQVYSPPPPPVVIVPGGPLVPGAGPFAPRFNYVEDPIPRPGQRVPVITAPPREAPREDPPLPGVPAGGFRPLRPEDRDRALEPVRPDPPKPPPDKPKVDEKPRPKPPDRLPLPPQPEPDPMAESARQIARGKDAFVNQEYGRAIHRFRLALTATPDDSLPFFLLGQTFFAMGKYSEAFEMIQHGLRLRPDWPKVRFQPLELYEPNVALYPEQLRLLEETLAKHPDDAVLLFLYAYQLWFDGRKDEARPLFQRAAPRLPDRTMSDRFLQVMPGAFFFFFFFFFFWCSPARS